MSWWRLRALNWMEFVGETLRAALEALAVAAPVRLSGLVPAKWAERYGPCVDDCCFPKSEEVCEQWSRRVGQDGFFRWKRSAPPRPVSGGAPCQGRRLRSGPDPLGRIRPPRPEHLRRRYMRGLAVRTSCTTRPQEQPDLQTTANCPGPAMTSRSQYRRRDRTRQPALPQLPFHRQRIRVHDQHATASAAVMRSRCEHGRSAAGLPDRERIMSFRTRPRALTTYPVEGRSDQVSVLVGRGASTAGAPLQW